MIHAQYDETTGESSHPNDSHKVYCFYCKNEFDEDELMPHEDGGMACRDCIAAGSFENRT